MSETNGDLSTESNGVVTPRIDKVISETKSRWLRITWADGVSGRYPFVWLRDCSPDTLTYIIQPSMTARLSNLGSLDVHIAPLKVGFDEHQVRVEWSDGIESVYESEWLRVRNLDNEQQRQLRKRVYIDDVKTWDSESMRTSLQKFDWQEVNKGGKALHDWLLAVCQDGIAVITNAPQRFGVLERVGELIGVIHRSHFGRTFTVAVKEDATASNLAYAHNGALPFHTDLASLEQSPQLQLLHYIEPAESGGASTFVDGFAVAERMRAEHPAFFRLLSTVQIEYIERGFDATSFHCVSRHRVIQLDETTGRLQKITFHDPMRSWFYDCPVETIQSMYEAMRCFVDLCNSPEFALEIRFNAGDMALWGNNRVLHGRRGFGVSGRGRQLEGCYFEWHFIRSRIRQIRDQLDLPERQVAA